MCSKILYRLLPTCFA